MPSDSKNLPLLVSINEPSEVYHQRLKENLDEIDRLRKVVDEAQAAVWVARARERFGIEAVAEAEMLRQLEWQWTRGVGPRGQWLEIPWIYISRPNEHDDRRQRLAVALLTGNQRPRIDKTDLAQQIAPFELSFETFAVMCMTLEYDFDEIDERWRNDELPTFP